MFEKMLTPLIDNLLAEYGITRADIIKLVAQGDDLAKQARDAINTLVGHVASIEQRQAEMSEGLAILLADMNERRAVVNSSIPPLTENDIEEVTSKMNGIRHDIIASEEVTNA